VYRDSYNLYAVQGWLFNHEGPRRGEEFVTRKITKAVARISNTIKKETEFESLLLGNIDVYRDWSDAEDCVDAVWKMLNQEKYNMDLKWNLKNMDRDTKTGGWPVNELSGVIKEYIVASGQSHTVKEFVETAFKCAGITDGKWIISSNPLDTTFETPMNVLVKINSAYYRPAEVEDLTGNYDLIKNDLNWTPKTSFDELVKKMIENDINSLN
jgi:GDPmannose 4,6-dehydratase